VEWRVNIAASSHTTCNASEFSKSSVFSFEPFSQGVSWIQLTTGVPVLYCTQFKQLLYFFEGRINFIDSEIIYNLKKRWRQFFYATAQCRPRPPHCWCFEITHTRQNSSEEWSVRRTGRYLHNTQQTQETNIHALGGMRTRDRSNQAASYRSATGIGWQQYRFPKLHRTLKLAAAGHSSIPKNRHLWKAFHLPLMIRNISTW
jgi:hypothetical protein